MSTALYRKYRSKSLDEIMGQGHITSLLSRALERGDVSHAYLLTGPHGVGKTSIARILAHQINQLPYTDDSEHLDIIEIDAASNNGVDDVRELRERAHIAPSMAAKKIYIIDEVHMLSKQAFNALLKILEEPPAHVVFILATTDYDKLPATIVSRVQRFHFTAISPKDIAAHLRTIATAEHIDITDDALMLIAQHSTGSFRDSINLLNQLRHASSDTITPADIQTVMGAASHDTIQQLIAAIHAHDASTVARLLFELEENGRQAHIIAKQLIDTLRATLIEHPEDIIVIHALAQVRGHNYPYIELLAALTLHYGASTAGQDVLPTPQAAPQPQRTQTPAPTPAAAPAKPPTEKVQKNPAPTPPKPAAPTAPETTPEQPAPAPVEVNTSHDTSTFEWETFLQEVKKVSPGSHSILRGCQYTIDNEGLIIYTGKPFNAKKLNVAQRAAELHQAVKDMGFRGLPIAIKGKSKPPEDADAANVATLMGGGEEVKL